MFVLLETLYSSVLNCRGRVIFHFLIFSTPKSLNNDPPLFEFYPKSVKNLYFRQKFSWLSLFKRNWGSTLTQFYVYEKSIYFGIDWVKISILHLCHVQYDNHPTGKWCNTSFRSSHSCVFLIFLSVPLIPGGPTKTERIRNQHSYKKYK